MRAQTRRRWIALLVFLVVITIAVWWIDRQLEPNRLTTTVLSQVGDSLQLELSYSGIPDYALKPEPRLLLPKLVIRDPKTGSVILSAERAEISLPWATLTGSDNLVITRIELDHPEINLLALRAWQARRPKTPFHLPTLSAGLQINNGTMREGSRYWVDQIKLHLPHLRAGDPAELTASGVFNQIDTHISFKTNLKAATPGLESNFDLILSGTTQINTQLKSQTNSKSNVPAPFRLALVGHYRIADSEQTDIRIDAQSLSLDGASPLPTLNGKAMLQVKDNLQASLNATLREWPSDWPALPEPLASDTAPIATQLDYLGDSSLRSPLNLKLSRSSSQLQATLYIDQIRKWTTQPGHSPLPPLNATLTTPKLTIGGIELEGVEIEVHGD